MRALLCLWIVGSATVADVAAADGWTLVWADEFDREGPPDPARWDYEEGFVRNRERQYYTRSRSQNARVANGTLIITGRKEAFPVPAAARRNRQTQETAEYTSASLTTRGRASWQYGRIEVRAQLPQGRGTWPAIWMLGDNIGRVGWPACGEIDIMEHVGFDPDTIHANVHTGRFNHVQGTHKGDQIKVPRVDETWHTYAIEWDRRRIDFFVDDQSYFRFENQGSGVDAWPFDQPCFLILNLAIGGTWGGREGIDDSIFPQSMLVDYVRVYQSATPAGDVP